MTEPVCITMERADLMELVATLKQMARSMAINGQCEYANYLTLMANDMLEQLTEQSRRRPKVKTIG